MTMQAQRAYTELLRRAREQAVLASCGALLEWDEDTYMPSGGVQHRGNQLALLAGLDHQKATDPQLGELLTELERSELVDDPYSPAAVNVREMRRSYDRWCRLPRRLVEEMARVTTLAQHEWAGAHQEADFARFCPWLEKIVSLKRSEAECLGYAKVPYDALLQEFEPGARTEDVASLFAQLRAELVPLVGALTSARRRRNVGILTREFPLDRQRHFGEAVAAALGFDFERGRLDTAAHPFFTTVGPGDCRITTRYSRRNFNDGFFGILHELGHALYEQGLDPEYFGTPMGEAASLGMHEAQSRLWENLVGRSRPFWDHFFPRAQQFFPEALADVTVDQFHFALNLVEPSCNRVRADEVTYNLHILIRFELEQALIAGDLRPAGVPAAWNRAYQETLGVVPANDAEGCLQDGHWSAGLIGYYPTYTLGNVFAGQLFATAEEELGDLAAAFARGEFTGLLDWLRAKVYRPGRRYSAARLVEHVTGSPPDHRPLVRAMQHKYGELYGIRW